MKQLFTSLLFLIPLLGWSQVGDLPDEKPLKIEATNKLDKDGKSDKGTALNIPDVIKKQPKINFKDSMGRKPVKMVDDRKLVQAGAGLKIKPKFMNPEKGGENQEFGDLYLGDLTTTSEILGIMLRDHGLIDNDRIRIWLNDELVNDNILLIGNWKALNINLKIGHNKIEFEAINEGSAMPNSAQVKIFDQEEVAIFGSYWGLSEGSIGTFIVTRVPN